MYNAYISNDDTNILITYGASKNGPKVSKYSNDYESDSMSIIISGERIAIEYLPTCFP